MEIKLTNGKTYTVTNSNNKQVILDKLKNNSRFIPISSIVEHREFNQEIGCYETYDKYILIHTPVEQIDFITETIMFSKNKPLLMRGFFIIC